MTFAAPWLGRQRVAFVPLFRSNAAPPDQIPPDWENVILRRVLYDPRREANGADRSLRAWLRCVSSGLADIDPLVLPMQTIDKQAVDADELEGTLGDRLRDQGMDAAVLVMLGGRPSGTNVGFWSRVVMLESNGVWLMELIHGLTGFKDLYQFNDDVDPPERNIDTFDQMSAFSQTHPTAFTKTELGWLDAAAIPRHAGAADYELQHIGLAQPPVAGRAAAVRIGNSFPYVMVEARKMTDQFEAGMPSTGDVQERGISSEGVIAYRIQTRNPTVQKREGNKTPLYLMTLKALQPGESAALDSGVTLTVTGALPDGFSVSIVDPTASGGLLRYLDASQTGGGDVSNPFVIGRAGWNEFKFLFSGGNGIIYAVDPAGRLLRYLDASQTGGGDVSNPFVIGQGGWKEFKFLFSGGNGIIYAVDPAGRLLRYLDASQTGGGDVSNPFVIGQGGWKEFKFLFSGGNGIIYAVDPAGRLLRYLDASQTGGGDVSNPFVIGQGGWKEFKFLFSGGNGIIYAVDPAGRLLRYLDASQTGGGDVSNPFVIGQGGWLEFQFLFSGENGIIYAVVP